MSDPSMFLKLSDGRLSAAIYCDIVNQMSCINLPPPRRHAPCFWLVTNNKLFKLISWPGWQGPGWVGEHNVFPKLVIFVFQGSKMLLSIHVFMLILHDILSTICSKDDGIAESAAARLGLFCNYFLKYLLQDGD